MGISRFVVSTGRCGSTLLASLLGHHPSTLNISELFSAMQPLAFPPGAISGGRFWGMLSAPHAAWTVALRHGLEPGEFAYPVDVGGRFTRATGVPPVAAICLPTMTDDPDGLFGELEELVPSFPMGEPAAHYTALFGWLMTRLGRSAWFERSGGSLPYVGEIAESFRDARFLHLYRDGCATAISMSQHSFFRMGAVREALRLALGYDPYESAGHGDESVAKRRAMPAQLQRLLPESFDPRAFRELPISPEWFGHKWSAMVVQGTARLSQLPPSQVRHLSYSELVAAPRATLARVLDFFELPQPSARWFESSTHSVNDRRATHPRLSRAELTRLKRACEPGERELRAISRSGLL